MAMAIACSTASTVGLIASHGGCPQEIGQRTLCITSVATARVSDSNTYKKSPKQNMPIFISAVSPIVHRAMHMKDTT